MLAKALHIKRGVAPFQVPLAGEQSRLVWLARYVPSSWHDRVRSLEGCLLDTRTRQGPRAVLAEEVR